MGLDVEPPTPPDLTNRPLPADLDPAEEVDETTDLRREELEAALRDGAWSEAFREWAEYTDLAPEEYEAVRAAGLLEQLDFFWHPVAERVRYEVPTVPADVTADADRVAAELSDLARAVVETLAESYVDWSADGTDEWSEETFRDEPPED
ncbi:hypothetical protein [Halorarius halobius]|uniref:hypothetical protein n=1 Tax=Halorarius halobius TaxID=2962671 RepID=UPI0020CDAA8A|nr:hypothetical protein [Halorarius halobius]